MKKITAILIVFCILCSIFIFPNFTRNVDAIGQHEAASGTVLGEIYNESGTEGTEVSHFDTAGDGCDRVYGVCTDGNYIWVVHNELWYDPGDDDIVYKYYMNGTYTGISWNYTVECGEYDVRSITTDGTNIWVLDSGPVPYTVHKFTMDGTYTGVNWSCTGVNDGPVGITTDGNFIWIVDEPDDEVYKYAMDGTYTGLHWSLDEIVDEPFWSIQGLQQMVKTYGLLNIMTRKHINSQWMEHTLGYIGTQTTDTLLLLRQMEIIYG